MQFNYSASQIRMFLLFCFGFVSIPFMFRSSCYQQRKGKERCMGMNSFVLYCVLLCSFNLLFVLLVLCCVSMFFVSSVFVCIYVSRDRGRHKEHNTKCQHSRKSLFYFMLAVWLSGTPVGIGGSRVGGRSFPDIFENVCV